MTDDDSLPPDPEEFVTIWQKSRTSSEVAWVMRRSLCQVIEWANNLRAEGVKLDERPVRRPPSSG